MYLIFNFLFILLEAPQSVLVKPGGPSYWKNFEEDLDIRCFFHTWHKFVNVLDKYCQSVVSDQIVKVRLITLHDLRLFIIASVSSQSVTLFQLLISKLIIYFRTYCSFILIHLYVSYNVLNSHVM